MKKITILAMAIFGFGSVHAQEFKFGPKVGGNLSTLTGDAISDDVEMKFGFHVGAVAEIKFTDKLALQPEVLYSLQGAKTSDTFDEFGFLYKDESKVNLSYINVPVMLKFYPVKQFFIQAGPQVGFLVAAKSKDESTITAPDNTITTESTTTDIKDQLKTVDFSFNAGLGFDFTENFFIDARYSIGLTNIYDAPDVFGFGTEFDAKNSNISLSVGYKF